MIVLSDGKGVATPYENAYAFLMRMRDGEVDSNSPSDPCDRVKPSDR